MMYDIHVSREILLIQKCVFNTSVLTTHMSIIQKISKFYIYIYIYIYIYMYDAKTLKLTYNIEYWSYEAL